MDRTLMPIGVASISFTCFMSGASIERTWSGSFFFFVTASRPGIRLSSTRVVFPEPETPVTRVSLPFGISTSRGFTVWIAEVERWILPKAKRSSAFVLSLTEIAVPERKGPIFEAGSRVRSCTVPWAMTCPSPGTCFSGPISMIHWALESTWVS